MSTEPASRRFHVGAQNDALYIISGRAPATTNDYPNHDADRTCIAKVFDEAEARRLVTLANQAGDKGSAADDWVRGWADYWRDRALKAEDAYTNMRDFAKANGLNTTAEQAKDSNS